MMRMGSQNWCRHQRISIIQKRHPRRESVGKGRVKNLTKRLWFMQQNIFNKERRRPLCWHLWDRRRVVKIHLELLKKGSEQKKKSWETGNCLEVTFSIHTQSDKSFVFPKVETPRHNLCDKKVCSLLTDRLLFIETGWLQQTPSCIWAQPMGRLLGGGLN